MCCWASCCRLARLSASRLRRRLRAAAKSKSHGPPCVRVNAKPSSILFHVMFCCVSTCVSASLLRVPLRLLSVTACALCEFRELFSVLVSALFGLLRSVSLVVLDYLCGPFLNFLIICTRFRPFLHSPACSPISNSLLCCHCHPATDICKPDFEGFYPSINLQMEKVLLGGSTEMVDTSVGFAACDKR